MTNEQNKINEAFEMYLQSSLSDEACTKIAAYYGVEIAAKVKHIYDDAKTCPVDWHTATIDEALSVMHQLLDSKYSWLSAKARTNLNYAFIMCWK